MKSIKAVNTIISIVETVKPYIRIIRAFLDAVEQFVNSLNLQKDESEK